MTRRLASRIKKRRKDTTRDDRKHSSLTVNPRYACVSLCSTTFGNGAQRIRYVTFLNTTSQFDKTKINALLTLSVLLLSEDCCPPTNTIATTISLDGWCRCVCVCCGVIELELVNENRSVIFCVAAGDSIAIKKTGCYL